MVKKTLHLNRLGLASKGRAASTMPPAAWDRPPCRRAGEADFVRQYTELFGRAPTETAIRFHFSARPESLRQVMKGRE